MRLVIYAIAALQIAMFIFLATNADIGPFFQEQGRATLIGLVLAVFLIPALVLTIADKAPFVSLLLALAPPALLAVAVYGGLLPGLGASVAG